MKRKYISEFGINMYLTHTMVLQQEELKRVNEINYFSPEFPCHIYFICRRQRILINPLKFSCNENEVYFTFMIQKQSNFEELLIKATNVFKTTNIKLESEYPYNTFRLMVDGKVYSHGKCAILLQTLSEKHSEHLDLEVLYIGQSYGVDGARTAPDRLKNHSTLQGIYSEAIQRNPDCEIWLIPTSFKQMLLTSFDGKMKISDELDLEDSKHIESVTRAVIYEGLNEQQVINFTEAALIRYFSPSYNKEYKDTFPNPAHKTYSQCYDLDINSVCIELNTENIRSQIYSEEVSRSWSHFKNFPLHSSKERKEMFDLTFE